MKQMSGSIAGPIEATESNRSMTSNSIQRVTRTPLRNFTRECLLLALLAFSVCAGAGAKIGGAGGTHFFYDLGTYTSNVPWSWPGNNWYVPAHNVKHPIGLYHINPTLVDSQMDAMRNSGMDAVSLILHLSSISACEQAGDCPDGINDGLWGMVLGYDSFHLTWQHQQNLRAILGKARSLGFR